MEKQDFFSIQVTQAELLEKALDSFDVAEFCETEQSQQQLAQYVIRWMVGFNHGILNCCFAVEDVPISIPYSTGYGEGQAQRHLLCFPTEGEPLEETSI